MSGLTRYHSGHRREDGTYSESYWEDYSDRPLAFLRNHSPEYSDARELQRRWPKIFRIVPATTGGDILAEANRQTWKSDFSDTEEKVWWSMGENGILVRLDISPKDIHEAIDSLDAYPILDESLYSELETKDQEEQWEDWGRTQFKRDLQEKSEENDEEAIDTLLDVIPDKIFDQATWRMYEESGQYPEGSGDNLTFPYGDFVSNYDGSLSELVHFLGLEDAKITVRLTDTAFTPWRPGDRPGEKTRTLRISKDQLADSVAAHQLSPSELSRLIRDEDIRVPFNEKFLCDSLYLECEYPWEEEEPEEEQTETGEVRENPIEPKTPKKALANKAVAAMRVYLGSVDRVSLRDEQKLYDRVRKAVDKMAQGTGASGSDWWPSVVEAARNEGLRTAVPGKDI